MKIKIFCRCSLLTFLVGLRTYQHPFKDSVRHMCMYTQRHTTHIQTYIHMQNILMCA